MPVCFTFTDRKTNEKIDPVEIDRLMCEDLKIPCDPDHFCTLYWLATDIGCSSKVQDEAGEVVADKLDAIFEGKDVNEQWRKLIRKYLVENYKFEAWYQRHQP